MDLVTKHFLVNRSVVQKYSLCKKYTGVPIYNDLVHQIFLYYNYQVVCSHKLMFNFSFDRKNY